jgi:hypothetical protein
MRTASSTFHCLLGSSRRASFCGAPDPSIHLSPNGQRGSLYLLPTSTNSNESSLSNSSYEEQRRTLAIYDGRIPSTPSAPTIPFELMTPFDAITQTIEDPLESFVQIVLEEPDDRPPILRPVSSSRRTSSSRHRHQHNNDPPGCSISPEKLTETQSIPSTNLFNSFTIHCQAPDVIEPMDFSFLEPVLRGESAAPPLTLRTSTLPNYQQRLSSENDSTSDDPAFDLRSPLRSSADITILASHCPLTLSTSNSEFNTIKTLMSTNCLQVPSSED